jgi:hypothetical protein
VDDRKNNFFINFGVVKEASRISYHEWQQSIGVISWNKHWTFGKALVCAAEIEIADLTEIPRWIRLKTDFSSER